MDWIHLNGAVGMDEEPAAGTGKKKRESRKFEKDRAVTKSKKPRVLVEVMAYVLDSSSRSTLSIIT